jgi:hypothetical protein
MVCLRLKYDDEDVDRHGNVRIYFRRPGFKKLRLKGLPGSLEFQAAYSNALRFSGGKPVAPKHSQDERVQWLGSAKAITDQRIFNVWTGGPNTCAA